MKRFVYTPAAKADLRDIARYTRSRWNAAQAKAYLLQIDQGIGRALDSPGLIRDRVDIAPDMYSIRVASHVAYVSWQAETLSVIAVLHGGMDPQRRLRSAESQDAED